MKNYRGSFTECARLTNCINRSCIDLLNSMELITYKLIADHVPNVRLNKNMILFLESIEKDKETYCSKPYLIEGDPDAFMSRIQDAFNNKKAHQLFDSWFDKYKTYLRLKDYLNAQPSKMKIGVLNCETFMADENGLKNINLSIYKNSVFPLIEALLKNTK